MTRRENEFRIQVTHKLKRYSQREQRSIENRRKKISKEAYSNNKKSKFVQDMNSLLPRLELQSLVLHHFKVKFYRTYQIGKKGNNESELENR